MNKERNHVFNALDYKFGKDITEHQLGKEECLYSITVIT